MTIFARDCGYCWRCTECGHPGCDTDPQGACTHGQQLCSLHRGLCSACVLDDEETLGVAPVMCPACEGDGVAWTNPDQCVWPAETCPRCDGEGAVEPDHDAGRWVA